MTNLNIFYDRLTSGLTKKSITTCSRWAQNYRVVGSPPALWTFDRHAWLREVHDSEAEMVIIQKAAQMGFTETALNRALFVMDVYGQSVLYVLPNRIPDATDFSTSRFDPAIELSPYIEKMFNDVKNAGLKRSGGSCLYIRGSKSRGGLKSIPVGFCIADELDEFNQDNINLIFERMAGQTRKQFFALSTPTTPGHGINKFFEQSTKSHFFFKCPHCSKYIELLLPESLDGPNIFCSECKHHLDHESKAQWLKTGKWIPQEQSSIVGYQINHLYSTTVKPASLWDAYNNIGLDPAAEQEFWNSKKGEPHVVAGARLEIHEVEDCKGDHLINTIFRPKGSVVTLGIDVGKVLHYEIDAFYKAPTDSMDANIGAFAKLIDAGTLDHFEQVDDLIKKHRVSMVVIDANPETRKAQELAARFPGMVYLCYYSRGLNGRGFKRNDKENLVSVDRTSWLDLVLYRFKNKKISIPSNISKEYVAHLNALVKTFRYDDNGNVLADFVKSDKPDHFAHARNYAEIAFALSASSFGVNQNV